MSFELREGEVATVTHDKRNKYDIHTEVIIDASPAKVWAVLTDFDKLAEWSSSLVKFEGEFRKDGPAKVTYRTGIGNMTQTFDHPLVFFEDGREFG